MPEPIENARLQLEATRETVAYIDAALQRQQALLQLRERTLDPEILADLKLIAQRAEDAAAAVARDETELRQLQALAHTSALINSSLDLDTVLGLAMDAVIQLTGAGRAYILLLNEAGELETRIARRQELGAEDDEGVSRTILRRVIESGQPLLTDNAAHDPRIASSATVAKFALRSVLCAPLIFQQVVKGAVYVDNRYRDGVFGESEMNLLTAFANQIAIAVENARLFASVQATFAEIAQATELMENVFASIASGVITIDAQHLITAYNAAAAAILLTPSEAALGQPLTAVLPLDSAALEAALTAAQQAQTSSLLDVELEIAGRGRVSLTLKISPLQGHEGQNEGVAIVLDDLTEQRQREQTLDLLRRYLPPGMVENIHEIADLGIGGERRDVTCMFVDLGPLAQFGDHATQRVMELLNVFLDAVTTTVHQAGGIIDKYTGSEVMVLFNTQLNPQGDHAQRAVETALLLRRQLVALCAQQTVAELRWRIGIHTGIATLGNVGGLQRRSFTALGDCINLAKRLQENAAPGQIIVSEDTMRQVASTTVRWVEHAPLQVKGRQQLTRIYEAAVL